MTVVRSTVYPELIVFGPGVRFHDGRADVSDPKVLEALRHLNPKAGVEVPARTAAPAASRRRSRRSDG